MRLILSITDYRYPEVRDTILELKAKLGKDICIEELMDASPEWEHLGYRVTRPTDADLRDSSGLGWVAQSLEESK